MRLPEPTGDPCADLRAIGHAFRDRALAHPRAAPLVLTRRLASFEGLAPVDAVPTVLRAAGCPQHTAVPMLRSVVATLIGTLLREVRAGPTYGMADGHGIAQRQACWSSRVPPDRRGRHGPGALPQRRGVRVRPALDLTLDAVMARLAAP